MKTCGDEQCLTCDDFEDYDSPEKITQMITKMLNQTISRVNMGTNRKVARKHIAQMIKIQLERMMADD